jgi:hypothetical protein
VGEYGYGALQIDSKGFLHMIMGNRTTTTEPALHGMWHTVWLNNRWSELIPIVLGPKTDPFDPTEPVAVISQGNFILATWRNDATPEHRTGPWFSFSLLDAPEAPINPLPTIVPPPLETQSEAQIDPTPVITNTPSPSLSGTNDDLGTRVDPRITAQPLFLGIVPVILLILAIFVGKRKSR